LFTLITPRGTNAPSVARVQKKSPAFRRDFPHSLNSVPEVAAALVLTARILLLLSGFLATALLLAGLLARILSLLARILILVRHRDLPG
jgi:hypothetical protein